ncbi:MAG: hypothetical protein ABIB97_04915 [Patescibacteria group bacterium]
MTNQIDQIQKTEQEAEAIINSAHSEVKKKTAATRSQGEEGIASSKARLQKEITDIDKKAETAIKTAKEKIEAEAKKEISALDRVKPADLSKAVDLIVKQATK